MAEGKKILVIGSINGQFKELFAKIRKAHTKAGPIVAAYCVGKFFVPGCEVQWEEVRTKGCVIPLYIFGPHTADVNSDQFRENSNGELAPNVFNLGKRGLLRQDGLTVAYLGGVDEDTEQSENEATFSRDDAQFIKDSCFKNANFKGVDLLLTYEWPAAVSEQESQNTLPKGNIPKGSEKIAWLALQTRPQYVFSGRENMFYARRPYRNVFNNAKEHLTWFVALSAIDGPKYMSAFVIRSFEDAPKSEHIHTCPFNRALLSFDQVPSEKEKQPSQQFFFNTQAEEKGEKRKAGADGAGPSKRGPAFDTDNCWFCVSGSKVEKHLVVAIGCSMYIVVAKGHLTENHLIILPVGHFQSSLDLPQSALEELDFYKGCVRSYFKSLGQVPVFFERNFKTFHCQIHVVPVPIGTQGLKPIFQDAADAEGLEFMDVPAGVPLTEIIKKKQLETSSGSREVNPYFFQVEFGDDRLLCLIKKGIPLDFGRSVLASREVLNLPDRDNWKDCILSKEEETTFATKIRVAFKPFTIEST